MNEYVIFMGLSFVHDINLNQYLNMCNLRITDKGYRPNSPYSADRFVDLLTQRIFLKNFVCIISNSFPESCPQISAE
jgi:hypothetical protein